ncbi:helix-turn-helix transcriptional regulator [Micrococcus luteus]|uniref:helix-turn-helix transcriptional regulator n=1 Tax=Micrococcus luteus TaxID=1270 RepID=UPI001E3F8D21|nr:helix-turn-helix transcriptional regulator [Micrococcus luteus]MCD0172535.1 helix-turn-helix transcriptional regulator [Micrococcus luteus]MCD0184753.1 helix-turn-helix transcriptional regulator [Micrococcus luteus]MCV7651389.1 helix-turn-helix domain-containing protein [Micrococcus luteus]
MASQPPPVHVVVRDTRRLAGWSQAQLAERADVSRPTVARLEAGLDVSTGSLAKVLRALELQVRIERRDSA